MPFLVPWTDMSSTFVPDFLAYHRAVQDRWQPEDWRLELAVFVAERRRNRPALSLPACGPGSQRGGRWLDSRDQESSHGQHERGGRPVHAVGDGFGTAGPHYDHAVGEWDD